MASIKLHWTECRDRFLPSKCMRCGVATDETVKREFKWSSPWWYLLLCVGIGILIVIIIRIVLSKQRAVEIPICPKHRNHWGRATTMVVLLILVDIAVVFLALGVFADANGVPDFAFLGMITTWIISLPPIIFFAMNQIRPTQIDDESITLTGVDAGFASEVAELQTIESAECRERRAKRNLAVPRPVKPDEQNEDTSPP